MNIEENKKKEPGIDLRKLIRYLFIERWFILKITGIALVIGLVVAFSIPREYTCKIKMAPEEVKSNISGSVSDIAAMAGINIETGDMDGINLTLYPDIVQSIPFVTELANMNVPHNVSYKENTFYMYIDKQLKKPWWIVVSESPIKLKNRIVHGKDTDANKEINPYSLTKRQEEVFETMQKRISLSINKKTGVISADITMQDPVIAAIVGDSLVKKLERYIINYRTNKARRDFEFALKVFADAKQDYYNAQSRYANYLDENKNIVLESVLIEQGRLKNEANMAYNIYSTLAQQVETSRLKVQEQTPCVTVIEPARVPASKSNTSRAVILLLFCFLGVLGGATKVIYSNWGNIQIP